MINKIQDYILSKLASLTINHSINGIYLNVPANSKFPYIYIGDFSSKDLSVSGKKREEILFKIILYYRDKRIRYNYQLMKDVKNSLFSDEKILLYFLGEKLISDKDGITEQIILNYRAVIEE